MKNWTFSLVIIVNFIKENTWRIRSLSLFTTSFHVLDKSGVANFSPICKNLSYSLDFDHDILNCNLNSWGNISKISRKTFANSLRNNHPPPLYLSKIFRYAYTNVGPQCEQFSIFFSGSSWLPDLSGSFAGLARRSATGKYTTFKYWM